MISAPRLTNSALISVQDIGGCRIQKGGGEFSLTHHELHKQIGIDPPLGSMALFHDGDWISETSVFSGRGNQVRENLLSDYKIYCPHVFQDLPDFKVTCRGFYALVEEGSSPYFAFSHVTMENIDDIDEVRSEIPKMTILYDWSEEILIVKFMVGVSHELCARMLAMAFEDVWKTRTGDLYSFGPLGSARFQDARRMKEGDVAYKPKSRVSMADWPSIVLEVGVSEGLTQLQHDARFWLESSGGQMRIVIIVCLNRSNRSMVIQRWQGAPVAGVVAPVRQQPAQNMRTPNPFARNCVATEIQSLNLHEGQRYVGASLFIPAALAYDVLPPGLGPTDFEITDQMLNDFNVEYWRLLT